MQNGLLKWQRPNLPLFFFVLRGMMVTLLGFFCFRLVLVLLNLGQLKGVGSLWLVVQTFVWGLWFDGLVVGVIFAPPLMTSLAESFMSTIWRKRIILFLAGYCGLMMQIALLVSSIDIPFFMHFFARVSSTFLSWMDQPQFLFKMVGQEIRFWWFIGFFILISILLWGWLLRCMRQLFRQPAPKRSTNSKYSLLLLTLLVLLPLILCGRLSRNTSPGDNSSNLTNLPMFDKLSLNPLFTLFYSFQRDLQRDLLQKSIPLAQAVFHVEKILGRKLDLNQSEPLSIPISFTESPRPLNVVLVMMESVNNQRMDSVHMPELQAIAAQGQRWSQFYSTGIHTYTGLFATLCSFPVQLRRHALKGESAQAYLGLGTVLKQNGYQTLFFTTHDERFDNMGPFLVQNGFSRIISQQNYDQKKVLSTFGVSDHVMFDRSLEILDDDEGRAPFLAVLLTSSNHAPYRLPTEIEFKTRSSGMPEQMLEYSDWAVGRFYKEASRRSWAKRTLFVFLGDHGASGDYRYQLPYSMVHIPLIMKGAGLTPGQINSGLASQLDVMPTIMGLLRTPYRNLGFGVDLFVATRTLALFCSDDDLGASDGNFFMTFQYDRSGPLFRLTDDPPSDLSGPLLDKSVDMRNSALSIWRMADWLVHQRRQYHPSDKK